MGKLFQNSLSGAEAVAKIKATSKNFKSVLDDYEDTIYTLSDEIVEKDITTYQGEPAKSLQIAGTFKKNGKNKKITIPLSTFLSKEPIYKNSALELLNSAQNSGTFDLEECYKAIQNKTWQLTHARGYRRSLRTGRLYMGNFAYWSFVEAPNNAEEDEDESEE